MVINIAANYGGKWDITEAAKALALKARNGEIRVEDINEQLITEHLTMADLPEVDLFDPY